MFKNAARKIAHNTTVPGLPGLGSKQDLRALQDLITSEKAVLNSLQKLSVDFARASDALRVWGQGEGDDLADTLAASNALLLHFANALSVLANHEGAIREQMKAVRTREENLDELKRRRRSVISDADSAERKLSKMNPENKNLQQQTDLLNRLRDEIRQMDADIAAEEANLGDFKRSSVREWMGRKFGGLLECCEKGAAVGEMGKLIISEIPMEPTQPGLPRPYYTGHARTEFLVAEAARSIAEVVYSPEPNPNPAHRSIRPLPGSDLPAVPSPSQRRMSTMSANGQGTASPISPSSPGPAYPGLPQLEETGFSVSPFLGGPDHTPQPSLGQSVNEFGSFSSPQSNQASTFTPAERDKATSPRGGRFATFPVKALGPRPQPGPTQGSNISTNPYISSPPMRDGDRAPSIEIDRPGDESFSSSVAMALGRYSLDGPSGAGPSSSRFNGQQGPPPAQDTKSGADFGPQRYSPPPPMYTPSHEQGLPAGAAPSRPPTAMQDTLNTSNLQRENEDEDDGLAYMSPSRANGSTESLHHNGDRRVHFGGVADVDEELQKRHEEQEKSAASPPRASARVPVPPMDECSIEPQNGSSSPEVLRSQPASPTHSDPVSRGRSPSNPPVQDRVPSPPATQEPMDEKSLNAAAAREVSRELDSLMMSSPPHSPAQSQPPPSPFSNRPQYGAPSYQPRAVSPLPALNTMTPAGSQPTSPKLEGMYVRERDRSAAGSPPSRGPTQDTIPPAPAPASPTASDGSDQRRPSYSTRAPSTDTNGTPFRTPLGTPSGPPQSSSMYNLPLTTGSNTSFQGGARMISAAAFRRQQQQQQQNAPPRNMSSEGLADVSPLNVKKRPLPSSPYPSQSQMLGPGQGQGMRSVSAPHMGPPGQGEQDRPVSQYRQDGEEDEYDYISAYTDNPDRASGYGSGRFATNLEDGNGIR
ncbi:hypothetical protein C8T65DRAFT_667425 [Cerioporus squamosus]|nr:hypothetical protein C8T65DRAFT_667425 [Cerioporus squamosus]